MKFQLHLPFQLVGGVGRSFVSWHLARWARQVTPDRPPLLFDADPWGGWAFKSVGSVSPFGDLAFGDRLEQRSLDLVVERAHSMGGTAILDPGGAVARDVAEYFLEPVHADAIAEMGEMVAHIIVVGGVRQRATTRCALELARLLPAASRVVLWRNEYFDRIDRDALERQLARLRRRIDATVDLPHQAQDLARDLREVVSLGLTISEAVARGRISAMASQRLLAFGDDLQKRLACIVQPE